MGSFLGRDVEGTRGEARWRGWRGGFGSYSLTTSMGRIRSLVWILWVFPIGIEGFFPLFLSLCDCYVALVPSGFLLAVRRPTGIIERSGVEVSETAKYSGARDYIPPPREPRAMSSSRVVFHQLAIVGALIVLSASRSPVDHPLLTPPSAPPVATAEAKQDPYCHDCIGPCAYDTEYSCSPGGPGRIGYTLCTTEHNVLEPLPGFTISWCDCDRSAGVLCTARASLDPEDRDAMEQEAVSVVAAGEMLPANGLFYVGSTSGQPVVRWKCDGHVVGRLAMSYSNAGIHPLLS